jgi:hypothetical protein
MPCDKPVQGVLLPVKGQETEQSVLCSNMGASSQVREARGRKKYNNVETFVMKTKVFVTCNRENVHMFQFKFSRPSLKMFTLLHKASGAVFYHQCVNASSSLESSGFIRFSHMCVCILLLFINCNWAYARWQCYRNWTYITKNGHT